MAGYESASSESTIKLAASNGRFVLLSTTADIECDLKNEFDRQRKKGQNFARPKFLGIRPAQFDVDWIVHPEDDRAFWRDIAPLLRAKGKTGASVPFQVLCAPINRLGIKQVTLDSAKIGRASSKDGRHIRVQLHEWNPGPAKPKATPAMPPPNGVEPINIFRNQS